MTTPQDSDITRFDRFELLEKVGEGGFGSVYKARHRFLEQTFALKVLPPTLQSDAEAMSRFEREVRALRTLDHPHVVKVHDAGIEATSGAPFIAMSFVEGETLRHRLLREGPLAVGEAVRIGRQMADALHHLHTHDPDHPLVHRDVKPSNILLTPDNRAVLTDFGIAFTAALPRISRDSLGTPEFMSPEQTEGVALDGRSDIYSLGMALYECLTGRIPFEAEDDSMAALARLLERIQDETAPLPSTVREDVPVWLDQVVARCLEKNPEDRYPSAAALSEALRTGNPDPDVSEVVPAVSPVRATRRSPRAATVFAERPRHDARTDVPAARTTSGLRRALLGMLVVALLLVGGWFVFGGDGESQSASNIPATQTRVEMLLAEAEAALEKDHLTTPEGESAFDRVQAVLELEEDNEAALDLIDQIAARYEAWGDEARAAGSPYEALTYYERGLSTSAEDATLRRKRDELEAELVAAETEQNITRSQGQARERSRGQSRSQETSERERLGW